MAVGRPKNPREFYEVFGGYMARKLSTWMSQARETRGDRCGQGLTRMPSDHLVPEWLDTVSRPGGDSKVTVWWPNLATVAHAGKL